MRATHTIGFVPFESSDEDLSPLTFGVGWAVVEGARRGTDAPGAVEV